MTSSSRLRVAPHLLVLHFCHGFGLTATLQPHVSCYDFLLPVFVSLSPFFVTLRATVLFCSSCSCQCFFFWFKLYFVIVFLFFISSQISTLPASYVFAVCQFSFLDYSSLFCVFTCPSRCCIWVFC